MGCHSEVTLSPLLIPLLCAVSHFDASAHVFRLVIISYSSEHFTGCAMGRLWSTAQTIAVEKGSPRVTLYRPTKSVSPPRELSLLVRDHPVYNIHGVGLGTAERPCYSRTSLGLWLVDFLGDKKCSQVIWPPHYHFHCFPLTYFSAKMFKDILFTRKVILMAGPWRGARFISPRRCLEEYIHLYI